MIELPGVSVGQVNVVVVASSFVLPAVSCCQQFRVASSFVLLAASYCQSAVEVCNLPVMAESEPSLW